MQIVIPMSGEGVRFKRAGYTLPKFLIQIENKTVIQHVVELFPGEVDFLFICNNNHLSDQKLGLNDLLMRIAPLGKIVGIPDHKKGPVFAIQQAAEHIKDDEPIIVNYCDFSCYWNYNNFLEEIKVSDCDGAIPAYRGFHPHSLGNTNYAYLKEKNLLVSDIKEKEPFTENKINEFASSGTYFFKTGLLMKSAMTKYLNDGPAINGEYYVSLVYKNLINQGMKIKAYELEHFMQWGTPQDLDEYRFWSDTFRGFANINRDRKDPHNHTMIIPAAGRGLRFEEEGYTKPKPLIEVMSKPMLVAATKMMPKANEYCFVLREDMNDIRLIKNVLRSQFDNPVICTVDEVTQGQAISCLLGLNAVKAALGNSVTAITFSACDNGVVFNQDKFSDWIKNGTSDILVWGFRSHPNALRQPNQYGWIEENNSRVQAVSVKKPLANPSTDPIVTGALTFRNPDVFVKTVERLKNRNGMVNGEFYLDSCVNDAVALGYICELFEVEKYISWGTPNELKTFEYWETCFSKWFSHPFEGFNSEEE